MIGVAAFSLLLDFDQADQAGRRRGEMEAVAAGPVVPAHHAHLVPKLGAISASIPLPVGLRRQPCWLATADRPLARCVD